MTQKRVCLTCKNKGCVNYCRFQKVPPLPAKAAAQLAVIR